jgi:hypothetical protein
VFHPDDIDALFVAYIHEERSLPEQRPCFARAYLLFWQWRLAGRI